MNTPASQAPEGIEKLVADLREEAREVEPDAEHLSEPLCQHVLALVDRSREAADKLKALAAENERGLGNLRDLAVQYTQMRDRAEAAEARLASLTPPDRAGWFDISLAPKDETEIDLWGAATDGGSAGRVPDCIWEPYQGCTGWYARGDTGWESLAEVGWLPTHWMPKPAEPGARPTPSPASPEIGELIEAARGLLRYRRRPQYWGQHNAEFQRELQILDQALTAAFTSPSSGQGEIERLRTAGLDLALAAGGLVVATDGALRAERQLVLDALHAWEAALQPTLEIDLHPTCRRCNQPTNGIRCACNTPPSPETSS